MPDMQMETDQTDRWQPRDVGEGTAVCVRCFRPIDSLAHYCPHCGEATGQLTHYLPFVNIPWQTRVWGQVWRQIWSRDVSLPGRAFRLFMVVWNVPIMLIGLFFKSGQKPEKNPRRPETESDQGKNSMSGY
jgi:hypothetical protein